MLKSGKLNGKTQIRISICVVICVSAKRFKLAGIGVYIGVKILPIMKHVIESTIKALNYTWKQA